MIDMNTAAYKIKIPTRIIKAISSESGLKIFFLLNRRREMCVTDIASAVGLSISAVSHQLKKMEAAGLVDSRRHGRTICYLFVKQKGIKELVRCLEKIASKGRRK